MEMDAVGWQTREVGFSGSGTPHAPEEASVRGELRDRVRYDVRNIQVALCIDRDVVGVVESLVFLQSAAEFPDEGSGRREDLDSTVPAVCNVDLAVRPGGDRSMRVAVDVFVERKIAGSA